MFNCILDPGHGGEKESDRFRVTRKHGLYEGDINLDVARRVKTLLTSDPHIHVSLTRESDSIMGLHERVSFARARSADVFVSIHHNFTSFETHRLNHPLVFIHQPYRDIPPHSTRLAMLMLDAFKGMFPDGGLDALPASYPASGLVSGQKIYPSGMHVVRHLYDFCPAIVTEPFFMSDPAVEDLLKEGTLIEREASAIASAIRQFCADTRFVFRLHASPLRVRWSGKSRVNLSGDMRLAPEQVAPWRDVGAKLEILSRGVVLTFQTQLRGDGVSLSTEMSCAEFLKLRMITCQTPSGILLPGFVHCCFPYIQADMKWRDLWTADVQRHVEAYALDKHAPTHILERVKMGLKMFPNHSCRIESLLFLAKQALLRGRMRSAYRYLSVVEREPALACGVGTESRFRAMLRELFSQLKAPSS